MIVELFRVYRCFGFALPDSASTCALKVNSSSCPPRVSKSQPESGNEEGTVTNLCLKFCLDLVQHVGLYEKMRLIHYKSRIRIARTRRQQKKQCLRSSMMN